MITILFDSSQLSNFVRQPESPENLQGLSSILIDYRCVILSCVMVDQSITMSLSSIDEQLYMVDGWSFNIDRLLISYRFLVRIYEPENLYKT